MYPKNAASPQRVAIGPVVQISDGAVQTASVSVKVMPQGGAASAGGGTIAYEEGVVHYVPTQAETNYASFMLIAYKTGCIPASVTVVTTVSSTAGHAGVDWANVIGPTTTVGLTNTTVGTITTYTGNTVQTGDSYARIGATGSGLTSLASQASVDIIDNFVDTEIADIQARLPAALVGGRIDASVGAMAANVITAAATATDFGAEIADAVWDEAVSGHQTTGTTGRSITLAGAIIDETTSTGTPTTTTLQLTAGSTTDDFYNDLEIIPTSGALAGQARVITAYTGATRTVTVDEAWTSAPASGISVLIRATHKHSKSQIAVAARTEMDSNSTQFAAIVGDTNELQTDWVNGGRLDLILDARASQTSVDDLPTNAELATALGTADDAVLAAIADVPTVAEFEARTPSAAQLAYIVANAATGLPVTFTTSGGSTTAAVFNQVDGAAPSATNDQYNGRLLVFTDGTLKGVVTDITDYVGGTTTATITAIPTAPTSSHNARLI